MEGFMERNRFMEARMEEERRIEEAGREILEKAPRIKEAGRKALEEAQRLKEACREALEEARRTGDWIEALEVKEREVEAWREVEARRREDAWMEVLNGWMEEALRTDDWRGVQVMTRRDIEAQRGVWRLPWRIGYLGKAVEETWRKTLDDEGLRRALEEEELGKVSLAETRIKALLDEKWKLLLSAVALLYQCLIGYIDRGGTKTCSSGSLVFRPTFVAIVLFYGAYNWIKSGDVVLFYGAYIWIKSRDVEVASGYLRKRKNKSGATKLATRLEVKYKPPRRSGNTNHIHLCMCDTEEEARVYKKIAGRFYDERNDGKLDLGNGDFFDIPPMPIEQEQALSVSENFVLDKETWVKGKVKEVYQDFLNAKDARSQPDVANNTDGVEDHGLVAPPINPEGHFRCGPVQPSSMLATELPSALPYQRPDLVSAPQDIRAFHDHDNVGMDKELLVRGEILQPVEPALGTSTAVWCAPLSGGPSVALDHGFWAGVVEKMNRSPVHGDHAFSVDDYLNIPEEELKMFDFLPQHHFQDNNARESPSAAAPMVDGLNPPGTESVETPSTFLRSEGIPPSVPNLGPTIPSPDLLVILAQQIQERDWKIEEQKQQIEEQKQQINFLEQELRNREG